MKIFFSANVKLYEEDAHLHERFELIVAKLKELGHDVNSDHVFHTKYDSKTGMTDDVRASFYRSILKGINQADLVVAEMTNPSATIGHQVTLALEKNKPVLGVSEGKVPEVFKVLQMDNQLYLLENITNSELLQKLEDEIRQVKDGEDIRFNFLIPPSMVDYLEWVSKFRRIPKSVFIRDLIKGEMEADKEYKSR